MMTAIVQGIVFLGGSFTVDPVPLRVHSFDSKSFFVNKLTRLSQLWMLTKRRRLPRASWAASGGFSRSSSSRPTRPIWPLSSLSNVWSRPSTRPKIWPVKLKSNTARSAQEPPEISSRFSSFIILLNLTIFNDKINLERAFCTSEMDASHGTIQI